MSQTTAALRAVTRVTRILKNRFPNLTAEEAVALSVEIVQAFIEPEEGH